MAIQREYQVRAGHGVFDLEDDIRNGFDMPYARVRGTRLIAREILDAVRDHPFGRINMNDGDDFVLCRAAGIANVQFVTGKTHAGLSAKGRLRSSLIHDFACRPE